MIVLSAGIMVRRGGKFRRVERTFAFPEEVWRGADGTERDSLLLSFARKVDEMLAAADRERSGDAAG